MSIKLHNGPKGKVGIEGKTSGSYKKVGEIIVGRVKVVELLLCFMW